MEVSNRLKSQPPQRFTVERGVTYQLALGGRGSLSEPVRVLVELWSSPVDPPPLEVQLIARPGGLRVRVTGLRGYSIELLFSPDLLNWDVVASYQGDASFFDHEVETGVQSRGFFRVRATAPQ